MQRLRRPFGLVALVCLVGFGLEVGGVDLARAGDGARHSVPPSAPAYQEGPLDARRVEAPLELPSGAQELLGLSVVAAILYGFRASGLARTARSAGAVRSPSIARGLRVRR